MVEGVEEMIKKTLILLLSIFVLLIIFTIDWNDITIICVDKQGYVATRTIFNDKVVIFPEGFNEPFKCGIGLPVLDIEFEGETKTIQYLDKGGG
jgi:hypothetical protein